MKSYKSPQGRVRRLREWFPRRLTLLLLPVAASALAVLTLPSIAMAQTPSTTTTASATSLTTRAVGHLQPEVSASSAYAPGGPYMAAAFSRSKALAGLVTGDTESDAEYNALTYCGRLTGNANCQGAEWVIHGWLALADYDTGTASKPNVQDWAVEPGQTAQAQRILQLASATPSLAQMFANISAKSNPPHHKAICPRRPECGSQ